MSQPTPPPLTTKQPVAASGQPLPPTTQPDSGYQNNPFIVALDGMSGLFRHAKSIAIILVVLSALVFLVNSAANIYDVLNPSPEATEEEQLPAQITDLSAEEIVGVVAAVVGFFAIIGTVIVLISIIIKGVSDVAAAAAANQQEITFGQAVSKLFSRLGGYLWLQILITVKVLLWSLLFLVPGIIMSVRYSLAGTAFFARDMKASEALKHSTAITKNSWMTTFASFGVFNLVTLSALSALVQPSVSSQLFRQFDDYHTANKQKPGAHGLSIAFTVVVWLFIALALLGLALVIALLVTNIIPPRK